MSPAVRWALVVLAMAACMGLFTGCEDDRIRSCSVACEKSGRAMGRYSNADGCTCVDAPTSAPKGGPQ